MVCISICCTVISSMQHVPHYSGARKYSVIVFHCQKPHRVEEITAPRSLAKNVGELAATKKFAEMRGSIEAGLDYIEKWYTKTNDTDVYYICLGLCILRICGIIYKYSPATLALDPNFKTAYVASAWDSEAYDDGLALLEAKVRTEFILTY